MTKKTNFYLLHIYGDVEPVLHGPYKSANLRDRAARRVRHADADLKDGIYRLDVVNGKPVVASYTGGELGYDIKPGVSL